MTYWFKIKYFKWGIQSHSKLPKPTSHLNWFRGFVENGVKNGWCLNWNFLRFYIKASFDSFVDFYSDEKYFKNQNLLMYVYNALSNFQVQLDMPSRNFPCHLTRSSNLASQDDMRDFLASIKKTNLRLIDVH